MCRLTSSKAQRQMFAENWMASNQVDKAFLEQQSEGESGQRPQKSTFKQLFPVLTVTGILTILCAALHLSQIWNYKIQLWERVKVGTIVWRVSNHICGNYYEYTLSAFGLLLPSTAFLFLLIFFSYKIVQLDWVIRREWCFSKATAPIDRALVHTYTWLLWDSKFLIIISLVSFISWLPLSTIDTLHRLTWLVREHDAREWPDLVTWMVSELALLLGDLASQLCLVVLVICESVCMKQSRNEFELVSQNEKAASDRYLHEVDSEFAESSQRSANQGQNDSGISSSTPYGCGVGYTNDKMLASFKIPSHCSSPPNINRGGINAANMSVVYGSETCSSALYPTFCPGSNSEGGIHGHSSPPPLPPPSYTFGYQSPLVGDPGDWRRVVSPDGSQPTPKLSCFAQDTSAASAQLPLPKASSSNFSDPCDDVCSEDDDDDEASRYFDQQGVLVSKL